MRSKKTYQNRVEQGFNTLFQTMSGDSRTVGKIKDVVGDTFNQLAAVTEEYNKALEGNPGFWDKRKMTSKFETKAKEIFEEGIDNLKALRTAKHEGRSPQDLKAIDTLSESLQTLVDKEGTKFALDEFTTHIAKHKPIMDKRAQRAQELWGVVQDNVPKIAKLAQKDRELGLHSGYHPEYFSPDHYPIALGTGTELLSALEMVVNTGQAPDQYKNFDSKNPKENLKQTMERTWEECGRNRHKFYNIMKDEFSQSPHIPKEWIGKNFKNVKYLTPEERQDYKLTIKDGLLYQGEELFDTSKMHSKGSIGKAAFIITSEGEILAAEHKGGEFHHSSFMSGERVAMAGMIEVKDGKIMEINNVSGHYKPGEHNMVHGLQLVKGIETTFDENGKVRVEYSPSQKAPENLHDFMERAEPLANQKWKDIFSERAQYWDKVLHREPKQEEISSNISEEFEPKKGLVLEIPSPPVKKGSSHDLPVPSGLNESVGLEGKKATSEMFALAQESPLNIEAFERAGRMALESGVGNIHELTLNGKTLGQYLEDSPAVNKEEGIQSLTKVTTLSQSLEVSEKLKNSGIKDVEESVKTNAPTTTRVVDNSQKSQGIM